MVEEDFKGPNLNDSVSLYIVKNNRAPPFNYDKWFQRAVARNCLLDDYEQIWEDLAPFHQLGRDEYRRRLNLLAEDHPDMNKVSIVMGNAQQGDSGLSALNSGWRTLFEKSSLPVQRVLVFVNNYDEPRILAYNQRPDVEREFNDVKIKWLDRGNADYSELMNKFCEIRDPLNPVGLINENHGFLIQPDSWEYTVNAFPVLGHTKLSGCFSDIVFPSNYHYPFHPSLDKSKAWEERLPKLYWRGKSTGGHAAKDNWVHFHRQRLIQMYKNNTELFDIGIVAYPQCEEEACEAQKQRLGETPRDPPHAHEAYKYILDIDGNTFSGRFPRLLVSGGLVFKMTIFTEYFSKWLQPYVHYIPVSPDLSDLESKIKWAIDHDEKAKEIAENGRRFALTRLSNEQMECYTELLLLEMSRLETGNEMK